MRKLEQTCLRKTAYGAWHGFRHPWKYFDFVDCIRFWMRKSKLYFSINLFPKLCILKKKKKLECTCAMYLCNYFKIILIHYCSYVRILYLTWLPSIWKRASSTSSFPHDLLCSSFCEVTFFADSLTQSTPNVLPNEAWCKPFF